MDMMAKDLPNVTEFIQYDPPGSIEDYFYRIHKASGRVLVFLTEEESGLL